MIIIKRIKEIFHISDYKCSTIGRLVCLFANSFLNKTSTAHITDSDNELSFPHSLPITCKQINNQLRTIS